VELVEAFKKVWEKLYRPGVMCPDVELGHVHLVLAEVLAEQLPQEQEAERFVLAKAMIGPPEVVMELAINWNSLHCYEGERPEWREDRPDEYNKVIVAYYEAEDAHNQAGAKVIEAAIESLIMKGLVEKDERGRVCPV